ncbi:helix-turn-helix transcriptional regulator [Ruegeria conchae]|uniref:Helix-turn-helix protein n=1 Tax=Ruegeria conchae TaxID=981384 RepID=A0A497ZHY5_9RHOB|nr:hypothetical protein [Ruegeria conchae]RLK07412.1 hypothetical protein CLV75_2535 [Ruegeria conchae]
MLDVTAESHNQSETLDLNALSASSFLTRVQLAPVIGFSLQTLKRWAGEGKGPRITYLENRPRYQVSDVLDWIEEGRK